MLAALEGQGEGLLSLVAAQRDAPRRPEIETRDTPARRVGEVFRSRIVHSDRTAHRVVALGDTRLLGTIALLLHRHVLLQSREGAADGALILGQVVACVDPAHAPAAEVGLHELS